MAFRRREAEPLTDEQIAQEKEFLAGMPRFNIAAFLMPPIWGPAHGMWVTIFFYPLWLVADNVFYGAYEEPSVLAIILASIVFIILLGITIAFAIISQPFAAHRAESMGVSRETYLRRERWWILASAILAVLMLALATYYNLAIRPTLDVQP